MKALSLPRVFGVCATLTFLNACGGPQSQVAGVPDSMAYAGQASRTGAKAMRGIAYVYVSSSYPNDRVFIYLYPNGRLIGEITGLRQPAGECVDAKGDVYIANAGADSVVEVPKGGDTIVKTLGTNGTPIGCAVSPNGDLAVANLLTYGQVGNIQVFHGASGVPKQYNHRSCDQFFPPGYDSKGDLFAECYDPFKNTTKIAVLSSGSKALSISLFKQKISQPGSIMWDGKYLAITDSAFEDKQSTGIYEALPTQGGDLLTKVGSTSLRDACGGGNVEAFQPFVVGDKNTPVNDVQGTEVIGGNDLCENRFDIWPYPAGGDESSHFDGAAYTHGQAVSILN